jgi:hypothetical protein
MSEPERHALRAVVKPMRINAIGISAMAMLMAVLINFSPEPIAIILPIFFGLMGLGLAFQARKAAGKIESALGIGTVTEVRTVPRLKGPAGGWDFGTFSVGRDRQLKTMVMDGAPGSFAVVPDTKHLVSVNGVALKKPVAVIAPFGFQGAPAAIASPLAPQPTQTASSEELPPPPEDWVANSCPKCGTSIVGNMMFCPRCGFRIQN